MFTQYNKISTHALREEGDRAFQATERRAALFLPTPSVRRATYIPDFAAACALFLPTPSVRRATSPLQWVSQNHQNFYPRPP